MSGVVTEKQFYVHYYEVDYKKRALITSLMNYFGDIAMQQSEDLNMGLDFLSDNKIAWILYKWDINIKRYPLYKENIKVKTWACGLKKFYAYRKFHILDSENNIIGEANSVWFLINTEKRKVIRVPDYMYNIFNIDKDGSTVLKIDKIRKLEKIDTESKFNVRYGDIDTNRHVNNVKYVAWAIETVPKEMVLKYELKNLKVTYEKETGYGQVVRVHTQINETENGILCSHKIQDKNGNQLAVLETEWR